MSRAAAAEEVVTKTEGPKLHKPYYGPHTVSEEGIARISDMLRKGDLFRYGGSDEGSLQVCARRPRRTWRSLSLSPARPAANQCMYGGRSCFCATCIRGCGELEGHFVFVLLRGNEAAALSCGSTNDPSSLGTQTVHMSCHMLRI